MAEDRSRESSGGAHLLESDPVISTVGCENVPDGSIPDGDLCLRIMLDPGQASEQEVRQLLEALDDLYRATGGAGLQWSEFSPDEGGAS